MEWVDCSFCGSNESRPRFVVSAADYHPDYLNAANILGPEPPETFTVVQCRQCGLLYLNPRYAGDELAAVYPDEQYTSRRGFQTAKILLRSCREAPSAAHRGESAHSAKNTRRMWQIRSHEPQPGRILDVGCCNGSFLSLMEESGWETYGVDFSETAIATARDVFGQSRTVCGDIFAAGFPDRHFDVVTMYDTIEHLPDPRAALAEAARICKQDGLLVIQTVDFDSFNARVAPRSLLYPAQHHYYFRRRDLVRGLAEEGFSLAGVDRESIGWKRIAYYGAMHWLAGLMVALHRDSAGALARGLRWIFNNVGLTHSPEEVRRRLKAVAASNFPAFGAVKTFHFRSGAARSALSRAVASAGLAEAVA